ncbi:hypothetical protein BH23ACT9_BH23ACT9_05350 [soil metagenome]
MRGDRHHGGLEIDTHRIAVDGKQFRLGRQRFHPRGVTYGTFMPRGDGHLFPEVAQIKDDFAAIAESGFTVVRTYTAPPDDVLDAAAATELKLVADLFYPDWRYLVGSDPRERRRMVREATAAVRESTRRLAGCEQVMALSVGNEIPADAIRWHGTHAVGHALAGLGDAVREEDPEVLVTYGNYPTAEYLPLPSMDFLMFNVYLEEREAFRRYLTRLQHLAGDRPLVLGEMGLHAGEGTTGEQRQADLLGWQMEVALERGVAGSFVFSWTDEWAVGGVPVDQWRFGLTQADRSPRPALRVAETWNACDVADLRDDWPSISVVICAYNAGATLDECLRHTCALDYPDLEVVVVDDGSTDDTAAIARRHPRARLVEIPHAGLGVARNAGWAAADGDLVAYLDSDAYPSPEWPYYLVLGMDDDPHVGGVGGPNVPPTDDPPGAHQVARAPGGPVHVLLSDDRAEHVPGCNMAFRRRVLADAGGFDPVYESAGDDVDVCWKILNRGWEIAFHPAALVWHHRRAGTRPYLRQQRGYGRSEALVEARHPDRFTPLGTARWRGIIYDSFAPSVTRQRVYRGLYGAAAYQSVYRGGGHTLDLAHQVGVPLSVPALATAPLALLHPLLGLPAAVAIVLLATLAIIDAAQATPPRHLRVSTIRFRLGVAMLHLLQPLVRTWGRMRHGPVARRDAASEVTIPGPAQRTAGGQLILPAATDRAEVSAGIIAALRRAGLRVIPATGWEDHDGIVLGSTLIQGHLLTSGAPVGCVQVALRLRVLPIRAVVAVVAVVAITITIPVVGLVAALLCAAEIGRGLRRRRQVIAIVTAAARRKEPVG